jgi:hypothetical protein
MRFRSPSWSALFLLVALACKSPGPGPRAPDQATTQLEPRVLAASERPALFLGAEPDAPMFGFVSKSIDVLVSGPAENGRVPVRIDGPLRVKGFVPEELLMLRVQRRGRVRGTPTYVGPNDLVRPLGAASEPERMKVAVAPRIGGRLLGPYEGTYPRSGLGGALAGADAEAPAPGALHELAAGQALELYDAPNGTLVAEVPAQAAPLELTVVQDEEGWHAVRVGEGPYLIGYTRAQLTPLGESHVAPEKPSDSDAMPAQLTREGGALKRVAPDTRVMFNDQVVAVFKQKGWARVLAEYPEGVVDVFAAVDDRVAVRGLVPADALSDVKPVAGDVFDEPAGALEPEVVPQATSERRAPAYGLAPLAPPAEEASAQ